MLLPKQPPVKTITPGNPVVAGQKTFVCKTAGYTPANSKEKIYTTGSVNRARIREIVCENFQPAGSITAVPDVLKSRDK